MLPAFVSAEQRVHRLSLSLSLCLSLPPFPSTPRFTVAIADYTQVHECFVFTLQSTRVNYVNFVPFTILQHFKN